MSKSDSPLKRSIQDVAILSDSSDEEEIKSRNRGYILSEAMQRVDFDKLAESLNKRHYGTSVMNGYDSDKDDPLETVDAVQFQKSFLLNNLGRMVIYSPQVDAKYRSLKTRLLPESGSVLASSSDEVVSTKDKGIEVNSMSDLLSLGRLFRRSQMRLYPGLEREGEVILTKTEFSSKDGRTKSEVEERIVASQRGLSLPRRPFIDMVSLRLSDGRGDYASAYKRTKTSHGDVTIDQTKQASESLIEKTDNKELREAVATISELREEIAQEFPRENSDIFIVESMKKACLGEALINVENNPDIQNKIYALTYLLFQTEVRRSPAALISNIQTLDLIINSKLTLQEAFEEQKMPMSMEGALKGSRYLNKCYSDLSENSFYKYHYPYDYSYQSSLDIPQKSITLIKKEAEMFDKWIEHRLGSQEAERINENPQEYLCQICDEVEDSLHRFGLNVRSQALYNSTLPRKDNFLDKSSERSNVR